MSTLPQAEQNSEQLPDSLFVSDGMQASVPTSKADIETAVGRFWETVRKSADVIVTLRQENMIVNAQNQALRRSEQDLQNRVDELLSRITVLDKANPGTKKSSPVAETESGRPNIDRAEDELQALQESLTLQAEELVRRSELIAQRDEELSQMHLILVATEAKLREANEHLADNSQIKQQLEEVRAELEARTALLLEVQESFERSLHTDQMHLFSPQAAASNVQEPAMKQLMTEQEIADLAARLDNVADRVAQLLGIS